MQASSSFVEAELMVDSEQLVGNEEKAVRVGPGSCCEQAGQR